MTARELHDIVSKWPEGARHLGIQFHSADFWSTDVGTFVKPDLAADLHALAGAMWLIRKDSDTIIGERRVVVPIRDADGDRIGERVCEGPTLLLAVDAAVREVANQT